MIEHKDYLIKEKNFIGFNNLNDYDEPTYLTFRINFFPNNIQKVSNIDNLTHLSNNDIKSMSYDDMPEPLLQFNSEAIHASTLIDDTYEGDDDFESYINNSSFDEIEKDFNAIAIKNNTKTYSTYDYLLNSLGETYRAKLLKQFIILLTKLTWDFPYYIKSIEGISDLLDVNPQRGTRIKKDAILTIKCYEGLDQRISTLKRLYKKIVWDDIYQRWILPDMMRFFRMEIYISEFRIFHKSNHRKNSNIFNKGKMKKSSKLSTINTIKNIVSDVDNLLGVDKTVSHNSFQLLHHTINEIIPTLKLECKMCEFDISNMFGELSSLSASNPKEKMIDDLEIKIKVGNIQETYLNNLLNEDKNDNIYINDDIFIFNNENILNNRKKNDEKSSFINRTGISLDDIDKLTTNMFNQSNDSKTISYLGKALKDTIKGAISWGDNWTNTQLNQLLNKQLGKSGLNTNDIIKAVTSANVNTMYNTFKTKAELIKEQYPELSQATNQSIDLQTFESFLNEMSKSDDKINSQISKTLLDYAKNNEVDNIDEYTDIINEVNNQIQKEIEKKIIYTPIENNNSTNENNTINTKIIL